MAANFNTLFVLVQISIMVVFIFLVVQGLHKGEGVGTVWSLQPFISENAHLIPIITGATIVCFSFLGFDAVTTLSEETPDAARVIPKAIFLTAVYPARVGLLQRRHPRRRPQEGSGQAGGGKRR